MNKKLEVTVLTNSRKSLEFRQSLDCLAGILRNYCSSLMIDESEDGLTFTLIAQWKTMDQMRQTLRREEFSILSGAISALCEKTVIRLDDKPAGNDISRLSTL